MMLVDRNSVRDGALWVSERSEFVKVNKDQEVIRMHARTIMARMKELNYSPATWKTHPLHPKEQSPATVDWIFFCNLLNFSFWTDENKPFWMEYRQKKYTGYWALCAAIDRALDEGIPVTNPTWYCSAPKVALERLFRSEEQEEESSIPMLEERIRVMREAGRRLVEKYKGSFANCILEANGSARKLINLLITEFPSFFDVSWYEGRTNLWACFEGSSWGFFHDIDMLTMFADYRVPQVLLSMRLVHYEDSLMEKLYRAVEIPSGSKEEVEIRCCSICAVEMLREAMQKEDTGLAINSEMLDFFLWDWAQLNRDYLKAFPIHRTRSIYY